MNAAKITRQSQSNLALAFVALPRERRQDITVFYAFCRLVDDIADSEEISLEEKRSRLRMWRRSLHQFARDEPNLAPEVRRLMEKYPITPAMLEEIIDGVEMDLGAVRYETFEELRVYCHRVASAVGLVSIEIFGYRDEACREYAIQLGLALQMTNIIRDVATDLAKCRIYLPAEDMKRFDYSQTDLLARKYNAQFLQLMDFEASRAEQFFNRAATLLPSQDRRSMIAAEIMASVYRDLLGHMKADRFRVFQKEYRLSKLQKARHIASHLLCFYLNSPRRASV